MNLSKIFRKISLIVTVVCLLVNSAQWDEKLSLQSMFDDIKEISPKGGEMKDLLALHDDFLHVVDMRRLSGGSRFSGDRYRYGHRRYSRYHFQETQVSEEKLEAIQGLTAINLDVHIDVALIGFPSSTVQYIRDYWFDNLGRQEKLMFTVAGDDSVKLTFENNDVEITYHFHMIQLSFLVADSLRDRLRIYENITEPVIIGDSIDPVLVLHTWEWEDIFDSMTRVISSTHLQADRNRDENNSDVENQQSESRGNVESMLSQVSPSITMYVMKIPAHSNYTYCSEYTASEINRLRSNIDIVSLARTVQKDFSRSTHVNISPDRGSSIYQETVTLLESLKEKKIHSANEIYSTNFSDGTGLHWREAVKETRDWAKSFSQETATKTKDESTAKASFSLESSARKLLDTGKDSPLFVRKLKFVRDLLSLDPPPSHRDNDVCSSLTWISSSSRAIWTDINAFSSLPKALKSIGLSYSHAPLPERLSLEEWFMLGQSNRQEEVVNEIAFLEGSLKRHLDSAVSSYLASSCPEDILRDMYTHSRDDSTSRSGRLSSLLYQYVTPRYSYYGDFPLQMGICSHLIEMIFYINSTIDLSTELTRLADRYSDPTAPEGMKVESIDVKHVIQESSRLQRRTLAEAYRLLYSTDDYYSYDAYGNQDQHVAAPSVMTSDKAINYLSHLASRVLRLVRYYVAPPTILATNPQPWLSTKDATTNSWIQALPEIVSPGKIDVVVYLISLQKNLSNSKILNDVFDYRMLFESLKQLRLNNQEFSVNVHAIDISGEIDLALGLELCMIKDPSSDDRNIMGRCMLNYIRKQDIESSFIVENSADTLDRYNRVSKSKGKPSNRANQLHLHEATRIQYLPVFVLIVDDESNLSLPRGEKSIRIENSVLTVLNIHRSDSTAITETALSVAEVVGGLPSHRIGHEGVTTTKDDLLTALLQIARNEVTNANNKTKQLLSEDSALALGASPRFRSLTAVPVFNPIDLDVVYRSKVLRGLGIATNVMKNHLLDLRKEIHSYYDGKPQYIQLANDHLDAFIKSFRSVVNQCLYHAASLHWDRAIAYSNAVLIGAVRAKEIINVEILSTEIQADINTIVDEKLSCEWSLIQGLWKLRWSLSVGIFAYIAVLAGKLVYRRFRPMKSTYDIGL